MFSKGQLVFAAIFAIAFIALMIWSYRKDIKLHEFYYKKVWIVALGIFIAIALFAILTFSLHK
jgi:O-antigen/teichoic acid export membrane protein